ncbi:MAG: hypothetical protein JSV20_02815 [Candidatus Bathyarchaeota archaeon]|nr:MAG: hypothetical protein JSV20_02815 [Candidatus Bathyarchaeota archaeon]
MSIYSARAEAMGKDIWSAPPEIKVQAEVTLLGQHKSISIYDSPDEKTLFKYIVPLLQLYTSIKITPAATTEEHVKMLQK